MVFGRKKNKIKFDVRKEFPKEIKNNTENWEYIHNFKVHYKSSRIQIIASKIDLSVPSSNSSLPTHVEVQQAANIRLQSSTITLSGGTNKGSISGRIGKKDLVYSYHITHTEYKHTIAFRKGQSSW